MQFDSLYRRCAPSTWRYARTTILFRIRPKIGLAPTCSKAWFFSDAWRAIQRIVSGDDHINPKKILERKYLYLGLLATQIRTQRAAHPDMELLTLHDQATAELEQKGVPQWSNAALRIEMQNRLHPQVLDIFRAFQRVDERLGISPTLQFHDIALLDWEPWIAILRQEGKRTEECLFQSNKNQSPGKEQRLGFYQRKKEAIQTLLHFHGKSPEPEMVDPLDAFGIDLANSSGSDDNNLQTVRRFQTINLCRSALIRQELGYSILCLKSLIPGGQRGAFIDGQAPSGSIACFQPGEIWPKEHLMTQDADVIEHFAKDDDCHVSLRFDDYVVDSRQSPVTVLSCEGSLNPWALGHMVNHPPANTLPNCLSTTLNFTEKMKLGNLLPYIPNAYARMPGWKSSIFYSEEVVMHGLCLLALRDLGDEELLYDYRLQSVTGQTPEWYSVVRHGNNLDDSDQLVFFRDDWDKK